MATRPDRRISYEDYLHFPDDERWEVIDGEAFLVAAPNTRHQIILGELFRQVANFVKAHGGGRVFIAPFDVVLSDFDVLEPDLVFIADEDMHVLNDKNVRGRPTWVVEVLSDAKRDRELKLQRYELFGVPEYWIVDPKTDRVEVYRLDGEGYGPPAIHEPPGRLSPLRPAALAVDLGEIFAV